MTFTYDFTIRVIFAFCTVGNMHVLIICITSRECVKKWRMKKYRKITHLSLHWETKTNTDTDTLKERYAIFSPKVTEFLVFLSAGMLALGKKNVLKLIKRLSLSPGEGTQGLVRTALETICLIQGLKRKFRFKKTVEVFGLASIVSMLVLQWYCRKTDCKVSAYCTCKLSRLPFSIHCRCRQ